MNKLHYIFIGERQGKMHTRRICSVFLVYVLCYAIETSIVVILCMLRFVRFNLIFKRNFAWKSITLLPVRRRFPRNLTMVSPHTTYTYHASLMHESSHCIVLFITQHGKVSCYVKTIHYFFQHSSLEKCWNIADFTVWWLLSSRISCLI